MARTQATGWRRIVADRIVEKDISIVGLARDINTDRTTLFRWLHGHSSMASSTLERLAGFLGLELGVPA